MEYPEQERQTDPFSDSTSNSPGVEHFTCCACYTDLSSKIEDIIECPSCGTKIKCEIETVHVYRTELAEEE